VLDNIKIDLRKIGWDGMDWIELTQDRAQWRVLVNRVMNLRVPYNAGKFLSGCTIGTFSRRAQTSNLHNYIMIICLPRFFVQ
jgi:hypothetical protein